MKYRLLCISCVVALSGCASQSLNQGAENEFVSKKIQENMQKDPHSWMRSQFDHYTLQPGNKAFAVYWKGNRALGFGFATDKLDLEKAKQEALLLCNTKATSSQKCTIEATLSDSSRTISVTGYPAEVSSYQDVAHFDAFTASDQHAAVAGNKLGILGISIGEPSQAKAEQRARMECLKNTHYTLPDCRIIASK